MTTPDELVAEAGRIGWRDWLAWAGSGFIRTMGAPPVFVSLLAFTLGAVAGTSGVVYQHEALLSWAREHNFASPVPTAASVTYVDKSAAVLSRVDVLATTAASQTKQLDQLSRQLDALLGKLELARTDIAQAHQRTSDALLAIPERSGVVTRAALQSVIVVKREPSKPAALKAPQP